MGFYKTNRDGADSLQWRVSDYGGFLAHIMTQEARDFYALDKIFSFGEEVDFTKPIKKPAAPKTTTRKTTKKGTIRKPAAKVTKKPVKKMTTKRAATKKSTKTTTKK